MSFTKEAELNAKASLTKLVEKIKDAPASAKVLAGLLASAAAAGGLSYYGTKKNKTDFISGLDSSYKKIQDKIENFSEKEKQYSKAFNELALFAPTVASNPDMAARILKSKVGKGFDIEDVHRLSSIEQNFRSNGPGIRQSPSSAARAAGLSAILNTLTFGLPMSMSVIPMMEQANAGKEMQKAYAKTIGKMDGVPKPKGSFTPSGDEEYDDLAELNKKASAPVVSDEVLGRMIADRYLIFKEAGVLPEIEKTASFDMIAKGAKSGASALAESASMFLPIAALGGGAALVKHFIDQRRSAILDSQAKSIFDNIVKHDEEIKGSKENQEIALEAFNALKAFAPSMAVRPLVQKTFIKNVVRQGQLDPMTVKELADGENKILGIKGKGSSVMDSIKGTKDLLGGLKIGSGTGWKGKGNL